MASKKPEKTKLYIVIGLAAFALVFGYFRFFHKKAGSTKGPKGRARPAKARTVKAAAAAVEVSEKLVVPKVETSGLAALGKRMPSTNQTYRALSRDIFSPVPARGADGEALAQGDNTGPLKLWAVMRGGGGSIAKVNDKLLRLGGKIRGYEVVRIRRDHIVLSDGKRRYMLKLEKPDIPPPREIAYVFTNGSTKKAQ